MFFSFFPVTILYIIGSRNNITIIPNIILSLTSFVRFPKTIPTIVKSVSEKVVFANPIELNTGYIPAIRNVATTPCTNAPVIQPFNPPVALPHTPAVAPQKKWRTAPGRTIATAIHAFPISARITSATIPPRKEQKKPINTAFGA